MRTPAHPSSLWVCQYRCKYPCLDCLDSSTEMKIQAIEAKLRLMERGIDNPSHPGASALPTPPVSYQAAHQGASQNSHRDSYRRQQHRHANNFSRSRPYSRTRRWPQFDLCVLVVVDMYVCVLILWVPILKQLSHVTIYNYKLIFLDSCCSCKTMWSVSWKLLSPETSPWQPLSFPCYGSVQDLIILFLKRLLVFIMKWSQIECTCTELQKSGVTR